MAFRWKKNPRPTGLAGVVAGPQGSTLSDGDVKYASTGFISTRFGHTVEGWYWVARNDKAGVSLVNTCDAPLADEAEAKAAAMAYVRACLKSATQATKGGSLDAEIRAAAVKPPLSDKDPTNIQY